MVASAEYPAMLNALATLYTNTGKLPQAEELYLEAQEILDRLEGDNWELQGAITNNMAQLLFELGNYDEAEEIYMNLLADDLEYYGDESANYGISAYALGRITLSTR